MVPDKYGMWEYARQRNPIIKRGAQVSWKGRNYTVSALSDGNNVVLKDRVIVHPTEVRPPVVGMPPKGTEAEHPALHLLRGLVIDDLGPVEAMTKLYEMKRLLK